MERLFYLLLALGYLVPVIVIGFCRPDLWPVIWRAGVTGIFIKVVPEVWYSSNNWHLLTLLPWPTLEDGIYGFGITALTVCICPVLFRLRYEVEPDSEEGESATAIERGLVLLVAYLLLVALEVWVGLELPRALVVACLVIGLLPCLRHPKLLLLMAASGVAMSLIAFAYYAVALKWLAPLIGGVSGDQYLQQVWQSYHAPDDLRLGGVPIIELAWSIVRSFAIVGVWALCMRPAFTQHRSSSTMSPYYSGDAGSP